MPSTDAELDSAIEEPAGGAASVLLSRTDDTADVEAGLDALEAQEALRVPWYRKVLRSVVPPIVAIALVIVVWQLIYLAGVKPSYALPSPASVWSTLVDAWQQGTVQEAIWTSVSRGLSGFLIAVIIATPLGLAVARIPVLRAAIGPILSALQTLPSIAWVPAAIIWFGVTDAAIYAVVLLGAVPSIANGLVAGIDQTPTIYGRVGRVLGARNLALARHVLLPAAAPGYLAGLKQGWAFAWRSLMAAELIAYSPALGLGLGQLLQTGRDLNDMSVVLAAIIAILLVGLAIELILFAPLERRLLRTRGLAGAGR